MSYTTPLLPDGEPYPYVRYLREENGSLHEQFSGPPFGDVPPGMTEINEVTYLTELEALENIVEDHVRTILADEAQQRADDHAALIKAKIPTGVAARMVGHDPDTHAARLVEAAQYADPKRRTTRRAV